MLVGFLDEAILRVTDIFFAFPGLVLAIVLVTVFGRNLTMLTIAVLVIWWPLYVRLVRSQILTEKEKPYAEASASNGSEQVPCSISAHSTQLNIPSAGSTYT